MVHWRRGGLAVLYSSIVSAVIGGEANHQLRRTLSAFPCPIELSLPFARCPASVQQYSLSVRAVMQPNTARKRQACQDYIGIPINTFTATGLIVQLRRIVSPFWIARR